MPSSYEVNKAKGQNGDHAASNPPLAKSASGISKPGSRANMSSPMSSASLRGKNYARRQSLSFNFPHVDSLISVPSHAQLEEIDMDKVPWWTSHRLRLAIVCFLGFVSLYAQRVNLSIAIVSMVDHSARAGHASKAHSSAVDLHNSSFADSTYATNTSFLTTMYPTTEAPDAKCAELGKHDEVVGDFKWNKELEGLILGAFFWGYLVFQVPGGRLAERIGAKRVIAFAMFPVSILSILSPIAARISPYLFLVVRILMGLGEGVMYPAAQALWARWSPPNERSRLIGFSYAGGQFGNAIIFPIGGYLCAYGFDGGWASVFYIIGAAGFLWCCLWVWLVDDTPDDDKTISEIEKKYIKASIGDRAKPAQMKHLPWKSIITSTAVWAILVGHACGNYGAYMLLTKLPAYMKEVLKFDIKSNGIFSMLPYLTFWAFITISGALADSLISRGIMSIGLTRKIMSVIGTVGPAVFLIATGFMECDQQAAAVTMLTIAVGLCGFHFSGFFINHGDIAPAYAGTLFGMSNTLATIPGIVSPYVVSAMTKQGTRQQWQNTFYVAAAIYCFGAVWYSIFGQGEVQPWASGGGHGQGGSKGGDGVGFGLHEIHEEEEKEDSRGSGNSGQNGGRVDEEDDPRLLPTQKTLPAAEKESENTPLREDV